MTKPIIALLYDFDKTLCTTDMEDYAFIPALGYTPAEFWHKANTFGRENRMDGLLAYMYTMIAECRAQGKDLKRDFLVACGRSMELFPGVRELDPYEERLYLEKIVALETLGRHEEAEDLARRGSAMGCLHHAIEPGRAGSAYRQMRQADRNMESEVSKLISALPDTEDTGACICDFETFKEIYRVQRGVQVRYGLQVFLAILTVAPSQNTDAAETALMVEQLGDLIRTNLRQCDVAARYTDMQYVVMLSGSTAESGTGPLERIKAAFYRIPAHGRYLLSYSLYVPEAKADSGRARRRKKTAKKEK